MMILSAKRCLTLPHRAMKSRFFSPRPTDFYGPQESRRSRRTNDGREINPPPSPSPPHPIPNRPLRSPDNTPKNFNQQGGGGGAGGGDGFDARRRNGFNRNSQQSTSQFSQDPNNKNFDFLDKFKLNFDKRGEGGAEKKQHPNKMENNSQHLTHPPQEDADEIFKKMKETGLIPNAVAMLHGLCQDGLVQEAMKLFSLMHEKGTIPEVIIYTAVVEGFCKAQKLEDAKRIFRKMQNNGISPNAFSYGILVQGLYRTKNLDDALEFSVEMLEAGHSPNMATFIGLVDCFCVDRGAEEGKAVIGKLRQKGYFFDEKAIREFLDKKGPFSPMVWETTLGKSNS